MTDTKVPSVCVCVCVPGALPVTVNMEVDALSHGAPSTATAQTVATEEPPATVVSNQQQGISRSLKYTMKTEFIKLLKYGRQFLMVLFSSII